MEINEINKRLYELAFIQNGEYGYHDNNTWKPSIDEMEIEEHCEDEDGHYVPATPLGYRDYKLSRIQGIINILDQVPCVDLRNDKYHHVRREDNVIKLYDKIKTDKGNFVVCGEQPGDDDTYYYYVVDATNHLYSVKYEK